MTTFPDPPPAPPLSEGPREDHLVWARPLIVMLIGAVVIAGALVLVLQGLASAGAGGGCGGG